MNHTSRKYIVGDIVHTRYKDIQFCEVKHATDRGRSGIFYWLISMVDRGKSGASVTNRHILHKLNSKCPACLEYMLMK